MHTKVRGGLDIDRSRCLIQLSTSSEARQLARVVGAFAGLTLSGLLREALDHYAASPDTPAPAELKAQLREALRIPADRSGSTPSGKGED